MSETTLSDLDELVLTVRDRNSRSYITEAINIYRNRAFRSAIMSTWVAVVYDIISKVRELALQSDREAVRFEEDLDKAIDALSRRDPQALSRLQKIENELLDSALQKFEFLSPQEHTDLERLKHDRNLCAHPAFTGQQLLFQPTPELVRTHIAHAILHLLCQPPVQGLNALKRLKNDILQPSFPSDQTAVSTFLEARYLNHAKKALLDNIVTVLLKVIVRQTEPDLLGKEESVLRCLEAVRQRFPDLYVAKIAEQLPRLTDGATDAELKRIFHLFQTDKDCWPRLPEPIRLRLIQIVRRADSSSLQEGLLMHGLEISELKPMLLEAFLRLADPEKEMVISSSHRPELIDHAIALYAKAGSYRGAERLCAQVILPLSDLFEAVHIERIVDAVLENGEINDAAGTPEQLRQLFLETSRLLPTTTATWQRLLTTLISNRNSEDAFYACPGLRTEMERMGIWPPRERHIETTPESR